MIIVQVLGKYMIIFVLRPLGSSNIMKTLTGQAEAVYHRI